MTTLDDYVQKQRFKFCAFGPPKGGKTALAAQLARKYKLKWLDLEDGVKTVLNPAILPVEFRKNIEIFRIPSSQSIPMGIETILQVIKGDAGTICWTHGKWNCPFCTVKKELVNRICLNEFGPDDWLIIDSVTQLSNDANAAVIKDILNKANGPEGFVLDKATGGKDFKYPMAVAYMMDRIFSTIQAGNFNCMVLSHEVMTEVIKDTGHAVGKGEQQPTAGGEKIFPAAGSRNFSRNFGRYFDMLIHVLVQNNQHKAYSKTTYDPMVQTGSRLLYNLEEMKTADGKTVLPPGEALLKLVSLPKEVKA